jgi:glycine/D-amino acid oxidase-like deaminating enzyme
VPGQTNGNVSYWFADMGGVPEARDPLPGDRDVDVAIVGAGYTGLWTAYYLKKADPSLRIAILEREFAGFGASGRNGGWLSGEFGWSKERFAADRGRDSVLALQEAMWQTVDEVIDICEREEIDCDIVKGGALHYAASSAQTARLNEQIAYERSWGVGSEDLHVLTADEARDRIHVAGIRGATWSPHAARVQPAKLVRGLARVVEALGVSIFERTTVMTISSGRVVTDRGTVTAGTIVRATEGFSAQLPGHRRDWLPMNSAMIVTEPLSEAQWAEIGWQGREVVSDNAHAYLYAQRTADGRIALGGRGVPYRFGSRTDVLGQTQDATVAILHGVLTRAFPATTSTRIDHAWCGVLGVPRDWCASVGFDQSSRIGWAGGYVGIGVATANLAGRSLRSLILGIESPERDLPFVNRSVRRWEPEPLRWLGVQAMYRMYRRADATEYATTSSSTSRLATIANAVSGRS